MDLHIDPHNITSQELLRRVERLCIQEEPPYCAAACPLGVDARGLCGLVAAGDLEGAYALLMKAAPFMRSIAYTCPAPCRRDCKRDELGGAIEVNLLERAVIEACDKAPKPPLLLPKKSACIGVVGGGLRGMSAALHLAKKGYKVKLFEATDALGGRLRRLGDRLPEPVLQRDIEALLQHPVEVLFGRRVELRDAAAMAAFAQQNGLDALYLSTGLPEGVAPSGYGILEAPLPVVCSLPGALRSSVDDVFAGRAAHTTLDRLLQGVSPGAGREREGAVPTRLYTNTEGIESLPAVSPAGGAYTPEEAAREAARCIACACMECVKACPFMQRHGAYPKKYLREVYNNLSIAMGTHHANGMINTCALCGQCGAVCPNGLDMRAMFRAARRHMTDSGKMPPSTFEFALLDMDYSLSEACFLARPAPAGDRCAHLFFPGCQLCASEPALVQALYRDLLARFPGEVGLLLGCCGIMALWAGDDKRFEAAAAQLLAAHEALGRPTVLTGCLNCAQTLRDHLGMEAVGVWEVLGGPGDAREPTQMALRHACGGRFDPGVFGKVAAFAASLGCAVAEEQTALLSTCCGYGGLLAFTDAALSSEFTAAGVTGSDEVPVLTYCINCRDLLLKNGARARYLLELLHPDLPGLNRRWPTWSERQQNRSALKRALLSDVWGEDMPKQAHIKLIYSPALADKLEREHILLSDLTAAIEVAERSGDKLVRPDGHFLTYHRPLNVTFWVEYLPRGEGYEVFNAYTHRMAFELTNKIPQREE
ncbi:MAG: NAD(P)-binding protein [Clostridiales bacterium]|nr:NAD(P)-binding protein [Clostridiales bacterium]